MVTLHPPHTWFKDAERSKTPSGHLVQLVHRHKEHKANSKQLLSRSNSQQALMEDDVIDSTPPSSIPRITRKNNSNIITNDQSPWRIAKLAQPPKEKEGSVQDTGKSITKTIQQPEFVSPTPKTSQGAPGGSKGKATFKYILRDKCPKAFSNSLPDNVFFAAEDATYTIKSTGERTTKKDPDGNIISVIKKARTLYLNIISTADYMLNNTNVMVYHLAFDIPQFVPKNKAETQSARRTGRDEKLDANGIPPVSWDGNGIYLYPDTPLYEWQRINAESGGKAFRQVLSDVFIMLMAFYHPPEGKTLLVSGMLSHPSKKDPTKRTTCRKVYVLHAPVGGRDAAIDDHPEQFGNAGFWDDHDDEEMEREAASSWHPEGFIPYLSDVTPDAINSDRTGKSAEEIIKNCRATYLPRLHAHVRKYRKWVPGLRMTAGEGEVAIFHMLQIISGKAATAYGTINGDDPAIPRNWLLDKMTCEDFLHVMGQGFLGYGEHHILPGVVLRSADTDIIHLGLAAASHLDESRGEVATGWHTAGHPDRGEIRWQDPSFSWAVYLDMYAKRVNEEEYVALVRDALLNDIIKHKTSDKVLVGHVSTEQRQHARDAVISDEDEFLIRDIVKNNMGDIRKKARVDEFIQANTLYSITLAQINLVSPVPLHIRKNCKGYVPCPIQVIIAAAKLHGSDDYVVPIINNIPMGWYTQAVYSYGSVCNPFKVLLLAPDRAANPDEHLPRNRIRRILATLVSPAGYLNLTKGAIIECYHRKKSGIQKQDPNDVTMRTLSDCIKRYNPGSWLPKAPFYAPKAMRMLWSIHYTFLAQLSPESVPDATLLGWSEGQDGHLVAHIEPGSYHEETIEKKEDDKKKREDRKRRKTESDELIIL